MVEPSLHGGMEQRQSLSMAMQKNLQILQASSAELRHIIAGAIEANPVLEDEIYDYLPEEAVDDWGETISGGSDDESGIRHDFLMDVQVLPETLPQYLLSQVHTSELNPDIVAALEYLIGSLDDRGFFDTSLQELSEVSGISLSCLEKGLKVLRALDPPGVGAFSLQDSLLIQLDRAGEQGSLAYRIIEGYLDDLAKRKYDSISAGLDVTVPEIKEAAERISHLDPDPGAPYAFDSNQTVSPDIEVTERDGVLEASLLKGNLPVLRLSDEYKETMAESADQPEVRRYLKNCFLEGRQLIQAIELRQQTLLKLAGYIVRKEEDFFRFGKEYLKPLGMNEVAEYLGVHPATVSRAVSGKYLLCRYGMYELRFFFSSGYENESGEEVSSHAVREAISQLVRNEDSAHPLSDSQLAGELKKKGLTVARRTVAKYREQLKILPARFRKTG